MWQNGFPAVYNPDEELPICVLAAPKYRNLITGKTATFAGEKDEFVVAGSGTTLDFQVHCEPLFSCHADKISTQFSFL
jgi:hypothetical protein